jgi:hypothetical protein
MATDAAAADSARKPDTDTRTRPEPAAPGPGAAPTAPGGTSLGERQIRAKPEGPVIGRADDPAERQADTAADQVMRMAEPAAEPSPAAPAVQRAAEAGAEEAPPASAELQGYLDASKGQGMPLPEETRASFEEKYQRSFADVRIHDDAAADGAARSIGARAFTHGTDIYFRTGAYDPVSEPGKRLLAHELAHVAQQRPGVNRAVIRRDKKKAEPVVAEADRGPAWTAPAGVQPQGSIDTKGKMIIQELPVPEWKVDPLKLKGLPLRWMPKRGGRTDTQRAVWEAAARPVALSKVTDRVKALGAKNPSGDSYIIKSGDSDYHIGTPEVITERVVRPTWNKSLKYQRFDVDHKRDWQLGGEDKIDNLWLYRYDLNRSAGSTMKNTMHRLAAEFIAHARPYLKPRPRASTILGSYEIYFERPVVAEEGSKAKDDDDFWELEDLGKDQHAQGLVKVSDDELKSLRGSKENIQIFNSVTGGRRRSITTDSDGKVIGEPWRKEVGKAKAFEVRKVKFASQGDNGGSGSVGFVSGVAFVNSKAIEEQPFKIDLLGMPGLPFAAALGTSDVRAAMKAKGFSPIAFPELSFDVIDGFVGRGSILPDVPMLKGLEVALVLDAAGIGIEATIGAGNLNLPGPFQVTGGLLSLYAGQGGIAVKGEVFFEIEKLAKGSISASARAQAGGSGLDLAGVLTFDKKLFTDAEVKVSYRDGTWDVEGKLGVGPGHVKGIKSASAKVAVSAGTVTAEGEFESDLKGVDKGRVGFRYNEATGMEITGEILLGKGIPGVKSGKLDATVKQVADGWSLAGGVVLEPSVPGLTGTIAGRYEDGAFQVDADLAYERGLAKGVLKLGLTNQAVGPDGKPAGPPKADGSLTAYGGGQVTLAITPWLQGTVGLQLKPNGEIEVTGKVALPPVVDVFTLPPVERTLLSIGLDIPIVGVAVLGQRIGIFATIRGSLIASAGIGPGQLRDLALSVVYNPDRPDDTTVTGAGTFVVPANAGLRLKVDGGLGAGIPVVSATAGVSIFGEVGVAGAASAAATVNWSPRTGIVLDARGELSVEPKFRFGIEAYVDVSADLWLKTIELYHRKWSLASFEYGSNLRFGLVFPLHYESTKPFTLSFDQIQWTYPQIEPRDLLGGLMKQLVG